MPSARRAAKRAVTATARREHDSSVFFLILFFCALLMTTRPGAAIIYALSFICLLGTIIGQLTATPRFVDPNNIPPSPPADQYDGGAGGASPLRNPLGRPDIPRASSGPDASDLNEALRRLPNNAPAQANRRIAQANQPSGAQTAPLPRTSVDTADNTPATGFTAVNQSHETAATSQSGGPSKAEEPAAKAPAFTEPAFGASLNGRTTSRPGADDFIPPNDYAQASDNQVAVVQPNLPAAPQSSAQGSSNLPLAAVPNSSSEDSQTADVDDIFEHIEGEITPPTPVDHALEEEEVQQEDKNIETTGVTADRVVEQHIPADQSPIAADDQQSGANVGPTIAFTVEERVEYDAMNDQDKADLADLMRAVSLPPLAQFPDEARLGSGGFASVYNYVNPDDGQVCAAKLLDVSRKAPSDGETESLADWLHRARRAREKFEEEIELGELVGTDDPNIVHFLGTEQANDPLVTNWPRQWIKMEKAAFSLQNFDGSSRLDALNILRDLMSGLEQLEICEVIHRDIKPANVLAFERPQEDSAEGANTRRCPIIKLADFGCAQLSGKESGHGMYGTTDYLAPESYLDTTYSYKSDVYSAYATWLDVRRMMSFDKYREGDRRWIRRYEAVAGAWKKDSQFGDLFRDMAAWEPEDRPTAEEVRERVDQLLAENKGAVEDDDAEFF